jgi:hypothetical protein
LQSPALSGSLSFRQVNVDALEAAGGDDGHRSRRRLSQRPPGTTAFSVSPGTAPILQLERLQRLRESGALTEAEFAEQKRRILGTD